MAGEISVSINDDTGSITTENVTTSTTPQTGENLELANDKTGETKSAPEKLEVSLPDKENASNNTGGDNEISKNNSNDNVEKKTDQDYDAAEIYKYLADTNVLPMIAVDKNFDFEDLSTAIETRINDTIISREKQFLETMPKKAADLFSHLRAGGEVSDFQAVHSNSYSNIPKQSLKDDTDLQNSIITDYYKKTTSWDEKSIKTAIDRMNTAGSTEKESTAMLKFLQDIELENQRDLAYNTKQQQLQIEQQHKELINNVTNTVLNTRDFLNIPLNMGTKNRILDNVINDVTRNKLNSNFEKYRVQLSMLDEFGFFDNPSKFLQNLGVEQKQNDGNKKQSYNMKRRPSIITKGKVRNLDKLFADPFKY